MFHVGRLFSTYWEMVKQSAVQGAYPEYIGWVEDDIPQDIPVQESSVQDDKTTTES